MCVLCCVAAQGLAAGFDVTRGATQLGSVDQYVTHEAAPRTDCSYARELMRSIVYLPCGPEMSKADVRRLCGVVAEAAARADAHAPRSRL